jgi:3D (Asp-Asp-Asp) domain-containing protein
MMGLGNFKRSEAMEPAASPRNGAHRTKGVPLFFVLFVLPFFPSCAGEAKTPAPEKTTARMHVKTTAYTHTEAGGMHNAIGSRLRFGGDVSSAAADWSWLPMGTRFRVVETGRNYVVEDYGSGLIGKKTIDLYMPNMAMMRAWGVREVNIEILEWGSRAMSKMLLSNRGGGESARKMLSALDRDP